MLELIDEMQAYFGKDSFKIENQLEDLDIRNDKKKIK